MPRLFVGIDAGDAVRGALGALLPRLRELSPRSKWVPVENLHLTVVFLGSVEEARVPLYVAALDEAVRGHGSVELMLKGGGAFGTRSHPRVLWAGVEGAPGALESLRALHADAERLFEPLGHAKETRLYSPHLTLARARDMRGDRELVACVPVIDEALSAGSGRHRRAPAGDGAAALPEPHRPGRGEVRAASPRGAGLSGAARANPSGTIRA